jgi:enoyl-CoA hydratase
MLSADVRLAASGPWQIGMNEVAIGLTVPGFAVELARHRLTPPGFARVTSGALFDPVEAQQLGYVDRVVEPGLLDDTARELAGQLAALDMPSYAATKARINGKACEAIRAAIEVELRQVAG